MRVKKLSDARAPVRRWPRKYPVTSAVTAATALVSAAAIRSPELMRQLQRDSAALKDGQWRRLVTPMLVQSYGVGQAAFNLAGSAMAGAAVERMLGRGRWLAAYAVAGVGGVLASNHWHPDENDSGSSDAVAGLIGAMAVGMILDRKLPAWPGLLYGAYFTSSLTGLAASGFELSAIAGGAAIIAALVARRTGHTELLRLAIIEVVVVAGPVMTALRDPHGVGLVIGMGVAALLAGPRPWAEFLLRIRGTTAA